MTTLIYITHPSVAIDNTVPPQEWDLSLKGREEAKKLLQQDFWPSVDMVFTSTEPKAKSVGTLVQEKFGLPITAYQELGEADRTKTPFLPLNEYMEAIQEAYRFPDKHIRDWESHHEMFERNRKIVDAIIHDYKDKTIVIIGHGGAGTCVKCYLSGLPLSFDQDPQKTGCIFIADVGHKKLLRDWFSYC